MALEEYQILLYPFIDIFAILTFIFASLLLYKIIGHKEGILHKKTLVIIFSFLAVGFLFDTAAELAWDFTQYILKESPELGIADVLWIIGHLLVLAGFAYFAAYVRKQYGKLKKGLILIVTAGAIPALAIYYLIHNFALGQQIGKSAFEIFIDYFYPIVSALILVSTLSVYLFFRELKEIGTPMLLFAARAVFVFAADMTYTYYSSKGVYGILGVLSDGFFGIGYVLSALAFYLLIKRWAGIESIRKEIKEIRESI